MLKCISGSCYVLCMRIVYQSVCMPACLSPFLSPFALPCLALSYLVLSYRVLSLPCLAWGPQNSKLGRRHEIPDDVLLRFLQPEAGVAHQIEHPRGIFSAFCVCVCVVGLGLGGGRVVRVRVRVIGL